MMTKFRRQFVRAVALVVSVFCWSALAVAEEITTLGGAVYHQAKIERIEPDGITYRHSLGVAKLVFNELPEPVRRAHGYDPQKAAAYSQEATARQTARDAENRQLVAAADARSLAAAATSVTTQPVAGGNPSSVSGGPAFTFRQGNSEARALEQAVRSLGTQINAQRERETTQTEPGGWSPRLLRYVPIRLTPTDAKSSEEKLFTPNYLRHDLRGIYTPPDFSASPASSPAGR